MSAHRRQASTARAAPAPLPTHILHDMIRTGSKCTLVATAIEAKVALVPANDGFHTVNARACRIWVSHGSRDYVVKAWYTMLLRDVSLECFKSVLLTWMDILHSIAEAKGTMKLLRRDLALYMGTLVKVADHLLFGDHAFPHLKLRRCIARYEGRVNALRLEREVAVHANP